VTLTIVAVMPAARSEARNAAVSATWSRLGACPSIVIGPRARSTSSGVMPDPARVGFESSARPKVSGTPGAAAVAVMKLDRRPVVVARMKSAVLSSTTRSSGSRRRPAR
jgi:hypothetical protein